MFINRPTISVAYPENFFGGGGGFNKLSCGQDKENGDLGAEAP
jgi:hypothetical protein